MTTLQAVRDVIDRNLSISVSRERITADAKLIDDLGMDSLDHVEFVMDLEKEFAINISDEDAESLKTVGDVIQYVVARCS